MIQKTKLPTNLVKGLILAWIAAIAIDFFLNAGVFAFLFASGDPFLLPPSQAFFRIPAGYASLLFLTTILTALIYRGREVGPVEGMRLGLFYGAVSSLGLVLGLWSITRAPSSFLAVWFFDQTLEMTAAGTIIASARSKVSRRTILLIAVGALACFVVGVALQNIQT